MSAELDSGRGACERIHGFDWTRIGADLDAQGFSVLAALLDAAQCTALSALYARDAAFRSQVVMARHGYGRGEYKYFDYPLPGLVAGMRGSTYGHLAPIANRWCAALGGVPEFPETHAEYLQRCHAAGQQRPTPLLLQYGAGDYNCLHQDLYGAQVFPLQLAILLSRPGLDFRGGEFVLTEQRPRMQSRASVVPLQQGDAVLFAVATRPVVGKRGYYRVKVRHGVSCVHWGTRHTLGIIFHDAT